MNQDLQLKIQAYLDGELVSREARRVADWIESDHEAQKLVTELHLSKKVLADGELQHVVPESREFYWSKIQRALDHAQRVQDRSERDTLSGWRRLLAPLAGTAMVIFLGLAMMHIFRPGAGETYLSHLAEVETPSDQVGAYSFRSRSGNMFVVWLYDRSSASVTEPESIDDMFQ